jgi:hypothetical protein
MANEYLEMELLELQVAISTGCMPQTTQSNQTQHEGLPDTTESAA